MLKDDFQPERGEQMKSPEEIKKGIQKCFSDVPCYNDCPYAAIGANDDHCADDLKADVLEYIEMLEERISIMTEGENTDV